MGDLESRRATYARVGTRFAFLDDATLLSMLGDPPHAAGLWAPFWGRHQTIELDGTTVFVKRIPVTNLEDANRFSTRNLYDLPMFFNYGAGSVGFGAFRELVSHIKTTNWVLEGSIETFPLMYHYRVVSRSPVMLDERVLRDYVRHWAGSEAVGRYAAERASATRELVVCLEHVPHDMMSWLGSHQRAVDDVIADIRRTMSFLRDRDVVHFDAHFGNILTDGERPYLTDFGLVLDHEFDLTEAERRFLESHRNYDLCLSLIGLGTCLVGSWMTMTPDDRSVLQNRAGISATETNLLVIMARVLDIIEEAPSLGLAVEPPHVAALVRYRRVIVAMSEFLDALRENPRKDTAYDDAFFGRLLREAGVAT